MKTVPERVYIRKHLSMPVVCEDAVSGKNFHGVMYNLSVEGMYLELSDYLPPGREIEVRIDRHAAGSFQKVLCQNFRLKVIWCKEKKKSGRIFYGAGVRRITPETVYPDILKADKGIQYPGPLLNP